MTTTATCHTTDCPSNGIPVELADFTDPETGEPYVYTNVTCGACGQQITDLTTTEPSTETQETSS